MLIVGLAGAAITAALRYWTISGTLLAIAVVAAVAGFGGLAGAWLIMALSDLRARRRGHLAPGH